MIPRYALSVHIVINEAHLVCRGPRTPANDVKQHKSHVKSLVYAFIATVPRAGFAELAYRTYAFIFIYLLVFEISHVLKFIHHLNYGTLLGADV
jgi:hypothetical protein